MVPVIWKILYNCLNLKQFKKKNENIQRIKIFKSLFSKECLNQQFKDAFPYNYLFHFLSLEQMMTIEKLFECHFYYCQIYRYPECI